MEAITKIPGLQHISEDIFNLLDTKNLLKCRLVNKSWKKILDQPIFWLKKLEEIQIVLKPVQDQTKNSRTQSFLASKNPELFAEILRLKLELAKDDLPRIFQEIYILKRFARSFLQA